MWGRGRSDSQCANYAAEFLHYRRDHKGLVWREFLKNSGLPGEVEVAARI
jgi:hypothetical protein